MDPRFHKDDDFLRDLQKLRDRQISVLHFPKGLNGVGRSGVKMFFRNLDIHLVGEIGKIGVALHRVLQYREQQGLGLVKALAVKLFPADIEHTLFAPAQDICLGKGMHYLAAG